MYSIHFTDSSNQNYSDNIDVAFYVELLNILSPQAISSRYHFSSWNLCRNCILKVPTFKMLLMAKEAKDKKEHKKA